MENILNGEPFEVFVSYNNMIKDEIFDDKFSKSMSRSYEGSKIEYYWKDACSILRKDKHTITCKLFQLSDEKNPGYRKFNQIKYGYDFDMKSELKSLGYRPATWFELMAFAVEYGESTCRDVYTLVNERYLSGMIFKCAAYENVCNFSTFGKVHYHVNDYILTVEL